LSVDRRVIQLRDPLRQLGDFEVGIRIAQGVEPKVKVRVVSAESVSAAGQEAPATEADAADAGSTAEPDAEEEMPE
jgi:hypothetical protein